jgi:hypothetical protein
MRSLAVAIHRLRIGPRDLGAADVTLTGRDSTTELRIEIGLNAVAINRLAIISGALGASGVSIGIHCRTLCKRSVKSLRRHNTTTIPSTPDMHYRIDPQISRAAAA